MNRIDRLFGILLFLQAKRRLRIEELARKFEVSQRTIYRDMAALGEMGVPITMTWGEGYELLEGFYLPPLVFTHGEAMALVLGARMLALQSSGSTMTSAEQALAKLMTVLPQRTRRQVEQQAAIIQFIVPKQRFNLDDPRLVDLQRSIHEQQVIQITYHSYNRNEVTQRQVEPLELTYSDGSWYVRGYCRLRQAIREFRLERIDELRVLDEHFQTRDIEPESATQFAVRVRFDNAVVRWVSERQHYAFREQIITPEGTVMVYYPDTLDEMKAWLLSWGASAEVLAPAELRAMLRHEAMKLVQTLT
jgi:predicted DNA-binding transcriptional regulator YafY